jgi:AcrR family transcriptional regulator
VLEVPNRDRRKERQDATRAEILSEAWVLVRQHGLTGLSLRELAARVGMRAPSLYSYFDSKTAIYDAMFAQGNAELVARVNAIPLTGDGLVDLREGAEVFARFCLEDPVRHQLLFQRTIPGFEPSPSSYAGALAVLQRARDALDASGITTAESLDLYTALVTGLVDQQLANEPEGDRWLRLIPEAIQMFHTHHRRDR